jgi:hypothetical protein
MLEIVSLQAAGPKSYTSEQQGLVSSHQSSKVRALIRFELFETSVGSFPRMLEQVALENAWRYARKPIAYFALTSTGLDEQHSPHRQKLGLSPQLQLLLT